MTGESDIGAKPTRGSLDFFVSWGSFVHTDGSTVTVKTMGDGTALYCSHEPGTAGQPVEAHSARGAASESERGA